MVSITHEDYLKRLNDRFDYIVPLEKYQGRQKAIKHLCSKCGNIWTPRPGTLLNSTSRGCPKCSKIERNKEATKTTEQYSNELIEKGRPFLCVDEYKGANIKIIHQCVACGHKFMQTPHVILRTAVCPMCSDTINTTEKYKELLRIRRPDMEVLEEYQGRDVKILHRHSCGYEYKITPNHVLENKSKGGCSGCYRLFRMKDEKTFLEQMEGKPIRIIGKYQGANKKIKVMCPQGHTYYTLPQNLIRGHGCKKCASIEHGLRCRLTHEEYVEKIKELYPNITILSKYTTGNSNIRYKCSTCGIEATANRAYSVLQYGCNCNRPSGEKVIASYLSSRKINFIPQIKFEGLLGKSKKLSYDFGLPQFKLLIEYQGAQHERPIEHFGGEKQFKIQQEHDKRKKEWAEQNGYDILYIWYYDYDNIENILDECLKSKSVETAG